MSPSTMPAAGRPRRAGRHERGSVLVEFALVSAVALTMIFGITELGRALFSYHLVSNAARLGSRYAIVHGSDCSITLAGCAAATSAQVQTFVRGVSPGVDPNALTVNTSWSTGPGCLGSPFKGAGCTVTVQASYQFTSVVPLLSLGTIPMASTSVMIISQ
jgi:Flp pilus assembly protein TadG